MIEWIDSSDVIPKFQVLADANFMFLAAGLYNAKDRAEFWPENYDEQGEPKTGIHVYGPPPLVFDREKDAYYYLVWKRSVVFKFSEKPDQSIGSSVILENANLFAKQANRKSLGKTFDDRFPWSYGSHMAPKNHVEYLMEKCKFDLLFEKDADLSKQMHSDFNFPDKIKENFPIAIERRPKSKEFHAPKPKMLNAENSGQGAVESAMHPSIDLTQSDDDGIQSEAILQATPDDAAKLGEFHAPTTHTDTRLMQGNDFKSASPPNQYEEDIILHDYSFQSRSRAALQKEALQEAKTMKLESQLPGCDTDDADRPSLNTSSASLPRSTSKSYTTSNDVGPFHDRQAVNRAPTLGNTSPTAVPHKRPAASSARWESGHASSFEQTLYSGKRSSGPIAELTQDVPTTKRQRTISDAERILSSGASPSNRCPSKAAEQCRGKVQLDHCNLSHSPSTTGIHGQSAHVKPVPMSSATFIANVETIKSVRERSDLDYHNLVHIFSTRLESDASERHQHPPILTRQEATNNSDSS